MSAASRDTDTSDTSALANPSPRMWLPGGTAADGRGETARVLAHILGARDDALEDDIPSTLTAAMASRVRRRRVRLQRRLLLLREGRIAAASPSDGESSSESDDMDGMIPVQHAAMHYSTQIGGGVPEAVAAVPESAALGPLIHSTSYAVGGPAHGPAALVAVRALSAAAEGGDQSPEATAVAVLSAFRLGRVATSVLRAMRLASPLVSGTLSGKSVKHARIPPADSMTASSGGAPPLGAICIAAAAGAVSAVRDLAWVGNIGCPNACPPMYVAAAQGRLDVIRELIALGKSKRVAHYVETSGAIHMRLGIGDVNGQGPFGYTPLHVAAQKGPAWLGVVQLLLENGGSVAARCMFGSTPLLVAASYGHLSIVRALVEHVNPTGKRAVDLAATDAAGCTAVRLAVQHDRIDVLAYLTDIQDPPPLDTPDATRLALTPLELAARRGHLRAAQMLLSAGARLSMRAMREADAHLDAVRRAAALAPGDTAAATAVTRAEQLVEELRAWVDHVPDEGVGEAAEVPGRNTTTGAVEETATAVTDGAAATPRATAPVSIFKPVSARKAFAIRPHQRELM